MKTNPNFLRGLPSSSRLHSPAHRQMNRMEKKALATLRKRKLEAAEKARDAAQRKQEFAAEVLKESKVKRWFGKIKKVLTKPLW